MMIDNNLSQIVVVLGAVFALSVILIIYLWLRIKRLEYDCDLLVRNTQGKNIVEIVGDNLNRTETLSQNVDNLSAQYSKVLTRMAGAIQHVGVVRFDAFRDLGGLLSFSIALLDDRGNGLLISSIYGRNESRTYSKPVVNLDSQYELSPEEREAVRLAMQRRDQGALPVEVYDRTHEERMANLRLFSTRERKVDSPADEALTEEEIAEQEQARARLEEAIQGTAAQGAGPDTRPEGSGPERSDRQRRTTRERGASSTRSSRRPAGRVTHVGRHEGDRDVPFSREISDVERPAEGFRRPERAARRSKDTTISRPAGPRRPTASSPRGLDTPVDRLRRPEQGDRR